MNFKVGGIKMAVKIENEKLFVTINEHGAELASLINKSNGMNYLWSGDSKYWGRKSPVLFPIEGALKDGKMHFVKYATFSLLTDE